MVSKKKTVSKKKDFNFFNNKTIVSLVAIIIVAVVAVLLLSGNQESPEIQSQIQQDFTQSELTSLSPEQVVARVNGEDITGADVAEVHQSLLMQGMQVSDEEAIDEIIILRLLVAESENRNIVATRQDVENLLEIQFQAQGMSLDELKQQIETQDQSYEEFLDMYIDSISINQLIDNILEGVPEEQGPEVIFEFIEDLRNQADIEYLL